MLFGRRSKGDINLHKIEESYLLANVSHLGNNRKLIGHKRQNIEKCRRKMKGAECVACVVLRRVDSRVFDL